MEITENRITIDKPPNPLDTLVIDITDILHAAGINYAVVSGYVSILFGRSRATEDIDIIIERCSEEQISDIAEAFSNAGYWGTTTPLSELAETLSEELPVRIAEDGTMVPNAELKYATDQYDQISLNNTVTVRFEETNTDFKIGSLELQIAYKLGMGAQKDKEDAQYLYQILEPTLNTDRLETYVRQLNVEREYNAFRGDR